MKREGVYDSRYSPPREKPYMSCDDRAQAVCSRCGQSWRPSNKAQFSPCCHRPRVAPGSKPQGLPPRNPFNQPMPGDRLSVKGGANWREVKAVRDGIVIYRCRPDDVEHHATLHSWAEWAIGRTRANGRCPAKVERRGDA